MILTSKSLPVGNQPPPENKGADVRATDKETVKAVRTDDAAPPEAAILPEGDDMKEVFILDNAPVSEPGRKAILSQPGIYLTDGTEMTVDVVNGRYVLDEEDAGRRQMVKESLLKAGFRSAAIYPDDDQEPKEEPKKVEEKVEKFDHRIELMHPDNAPGNWINATVRAAGKRLKIVDGLVKVDNPKVLRALLKKGYIIQNPHTLERETDDEPDGNFIPPSEDDVNPDPDADEPDVVVGDGEEEPDGTDG